MASHGRWRGGHFCKYYGFNENNVVDQLGELGLEALFTNWRLYLLFPGDHGESTDEYAHCEDTDALEACLSSAVTLAVTSLRVPELDDGATRMRHLCARVHAMPRPPRD